MIGEMITYMAGLELLDELLIHTQGAGASRQTQHEGVLGGRVESFDAINDILGDIGTRGLRVVTDDESHGGL